jgi:hypothetical protein
MLRHACIALIALSFSVAPATNAQTVSIADFLAYLDEVRTSFETGVPRELDKFEWEVLDRAQGEIRELLEGRNSISDLRSRERIRLMNAQEIVNAMVAGNVDDQLVCRRERNTGTRLRSTKCKTIAEMRTEEEDAREALRRIPHQQLQGG